MCIATLESGLIYAAVENYVLEKRNMYLIPIVLILNNVSIINSKFSLDTRFHPECPGKGFLFMASSSCGGWFFLVKGALRGLHRLQQSLVQR